MNAHSRTYTFGLVSELHHLHCNSFWGVLTLVSSLGSLYNQFSPNSTPRFHCGVLPLSFRLLTEVHCGVLPLSFLKFCLLMHSEAVDRQLVPENLAPQFCQTLGKMLWSSKGGRSQCAITGMETSIP